MPTKSRRKKTALALQRKEEIADTLSQKQKLFCEYYAGTDDLFGNGTWSYIKAYGIEYNEKWPQKKRRQVELVGAVCASQLLRNPKITEYVNEVRQEFISDEKVDFELSKVILQDADYGPKVRAIGEHNKLRGRIIDKVQVDGRMLILDLTEQVHANTTKKTAHKR
jgi:hypothetical protein